MAFNSPVLRVMICSPGDTAPEREALFLAVHEWTSDNLFKEQIVMIPVGWESLIPLTNRQNGQVRINEAITDKADIFVGVFKHRFGQPGTGEDAATVEEITLAMHREQPAPVHVFFYDGDESINTRDSGQVAQLTKVHEFKASISKQGLYGSYATVDDLVKQLGKALNFDSHEYLKVNSSPKPFPTAGSTKVYTTQTVVNDNGANQAPAIDVRAAGLPTKPPAKTVRKGQSTRPQPLQNSSGVETPSASSSTMPKRPQRPDALPSFTAEVRKRASMNASDSYSSMSPSEMVEATERKRALERQRKLHSGVLPTEEPLPDIDDHLFSRGLSDNQISRNEKLSWQKEQNNKNAATMTDQKLRVDYSQFTATELQMLVKNDPVLREQLIKDMNANSALVPRNDALRSLDDLRSDDERRSLDELAIQRAKVHASDKARLSSEMPRLQS